MRHVILAISALLVLSASPALAQRVDGKGVPYRPWDVNAAVGFLSVTDADRAVAFDDTYYSNWTPSWSGSLDVGRYWNSHLKTDAGIVFLQRSDGTSRELVTLFPGQTGYRYVSTAITHTQIVLAGTYQFMENTFAHPYISVGARVGLLRLNAHYQSTVIVESVNNYRFYPVEPRDEHSLKVLARPFVAVGSKSYFSERTFVRPELALGFGNGGTSQVGVRLGFGVDF